MASAAVIMATVYGHNVTSTSDHFVDIAEKAVTKASENLLPGATLVNIFPSLRFLPSWLPGVKFRQLAANCRLLTEDMQNLPFNLVKRRMVEGTQTHSVLSHLLERNDTLGIFKENEDDIKAVATTCYAAGADTIVSSIGSFFLAMTLNPEVQRKAQEELDRVVGTDRVPNFSDRPYLPYIEAVYREVLRWRPALPIALPHTTTEDDIYHGYFIPKGSLVMSNLWAMAHDESIYSNPDHFIPDRFFDSHGKLNDDDTVLAFGLGRRSCIGQHLASSTVWLAIASLLSTFQITKAKDGAGNVIEPSGDCTDGCLSHPEPFKCTITPRSLETRSLIEMIRS
jgi:cytochrome P450